MTHGSIRKIKCFNLPINVGKNVGNCESINSDCLNVILLVALYERATGSRLLT